VHRNLCPQLQNTPRGRYHGGTSDRSRFRACRDGRDENLLVSIELHNRDLDIENSPVMCKNRPRTGLRKPSARPVEIWPNGCCSKGLAEIASAKRPSSKKIDCMSPLNQVQEKKVEGNILGKGGSYLHGHVTRRVRQPNSNSNANQSQIWR
jgi:hypothetical protein